MTTTQDWSDLSLMGLFRLEVETQVNEFNRHLLVIERSGWCEYSSLDALMRAAHSIKGAARIVQFEPAVKVAHALEDYFIAAQQGAVTMHSDHMDMLLLGVDLLSRLSLLEESLLATQLPSYDSEAETIVTLVGALITAAKQSQAPLPIDKTVGHPIKSLAPLSSDQPVTPLRPVELIEPVEFIELGKLIESTGPVEPVLEQTQIDVAAHCLISDVPAPTAKRMIRISADNLNRLMGLAGESLVESNWLQPFALSLLQLKRQQQAVMSLLEQPQMSALDPALNSPLTKAIRGIRQCHSLLNDQLSNLESFSQRFEQLSDRLYREVVASHMCAFEEGSRGYGRLVRDLSRKLGKQVVLEMPGLGTQVDRDILDKLDAPITHLLTNAIAHGIESPEVRVAIGKPVNGTIRLEALHRSGMLIVIIEDDGAGVDITSLRQKIVDKQLVPAAVAENLSDAELLEFLFLPGFSTAKQVDAIAGRGYGLDLARTMAQSVGGSLHISSPLKERSGGTRFQFQLPLTLSVVRSLLFKIAGETYAISLARIDCVVMLNRSQIRSSENRPYFALESAAFSQSEKTKSENISLVSAQAVLALAGEALSGETIPVVVIGEPGARYGLCIDRLMEERDLVVRSLDVRLGKVPNISAAALSEKGDPILILDVADVLCSAAKLVASQPLPLLAEPTATKALKPAKAFHPSSQAQSGQAQTAQSQQKRVLVVDDSMTVRAMEKKLLNNRGYGVDIAIDGAEGWNALRMNAYDLVITDVDMPRMSGIELIAQMRAHSATEKLPVIVVSYKDRPEDQLAGLNAGANYYLTKSSFHDDGLINAVVDLIGKADDEQAS